MPCPSEKTIVQYADFSLPPDETASVRAHVAVCPTCEEAVEWVRVHVLSRGLKQGSDEDDDGDDEDDGEEIPPGAYVPAARAVEEYRSEIPFDETEIITRGGNSVPRRKSPSVLDTDQLDPSSYPGALGRLGRYEILEKLGDGGFGTVVRGWDPVAERPVAIKMLSPDRLAEPDAVRRFKREIQASAIQHPHVVQILSVDEHRGNPILVMEYMAGGSLRDRLTREPPLTPLKILRYGVHIASGLAAIHASGVLHCDIKLANILLDAPTGGHAKISDFGLACLSKTPPAESSSHDVFVGTPPYMAPEQFGNQPIDERSDLFSLGIVLYAMVLGQSPFQGKSHLDSAHKVLTEHPRRLIEIAPAISPVLSDVAERLLQKEPELRIPTAREVADRLGDELRKLS